MRHRKKRKILKTKRNVRRALERGLLRSLILYGKIETTLAKAKFVRSAVERLITKAKAGTLERKRRALKVLDARSVKHLFEVLGPRYKERKGGYVRIIKKMPRKGDYADMAVVEFV